MEICRGITTLILNANQDISWCKYPSVDTVWCNTDKQKTHPRGWVFCFGMGFQAWDRLSRRTGESIKNAKGTIFFRTFTV